MTDKKTEAPKAEKADASKAQREAEAEFRRTRKVPPGWSFNVRDGLHKTPKKGK